MPVIVTVGLSRKLSKDFNSQGFSLNIQSELPTQAVDDPNFMANATDNLFRLANDLLEAQVTNAAGEATAQVPAQVQKPIPANGTGGRVNQPSAPRARNFYGGGNGHGGNGNGNGNGSSPQRGITDAQKNAIDRMAKKLGRNAEEMVRYEYGSNLAELSIRQASECIENLKGMIEAGKAQEVAK